MLRRAIKRYTLLFFPVLLLLLLPLLVTGKTLVYSGDGTSQHIPFMGYYAQWLRGAFSALLHGEAIAAYAPSMGYGSDILYALNWYGMGDPLCLLYGLLPAKDILISYTAINLFRVYLAGLAMIFLVDRFGKLDRFGSVGAICYAFGAFAFSLGLLRHPFFINPLIQLPLLTIGIDQVLKRESHVLFVLSVAWTALCGYYYLYMCCIFLFLFALIRHFDLEKTAPLRALPFNAGRSLLFFAIGLCIAAPVFAPACIGFLTGGRFGEVLYLRPFAGVSLKYYLNLPNEALSSLSRGTCQPAIIWLGFAIALFRRDKARGMRLALAGCGLVMTLLPVTDYLMNGFSYATARWTFGLSALVVFVGISGLKSLTNLTRTQRRAVDIISFLAVLYFGFMFAEELIINRSRITLDVLEKAAYPGFVAAGFFISWAVIRWIHRPKFQMRHNAKPVAALLLTVVLVGNVVMTGSLWLIPRVTTDTYTTPARLRKVYAASPLNNALLTQSDAFVRVDVDPEALTHQNDSVTTGVSSTVFYNSTLSAAICESVSEMDLPIYMSNALRGLNGRAALESLWSVTHFVRKSETAKGYPVPYGFELIAQDGANELYENEQALPFGYTTGSYTLETEYEAASAVEKQWMLLQGATLPKEDARFEHIIPEYDDNRPEYEILCGEGVEWTDGQLVAEKNGWLRLKFDGTGNSETYLELTGLRFTKYKGDKVEWEVSGDAADYSVSFSTPAHNQHAAQEDFLIQLGYSQASQHEVTITFNQAFVARVEDIGLICQPMDSLGEYLQKLRAEPMEDVAFGPNRITGRCTVSEDRILVLSLPYSKGWRAWVDGTPTELFASGTAFTAMALSPGTHQIELKYHTPGATAGMIAFAIGVAAFLLTIRQRRKRGKQ